MPPKIKRHCMSDRHPTAAQCVEEIIPASSLITNAVDEYVRVFIGIAPFPIMQAQAVMNEVTAARLSVRSRNLRFCRSTGHNSQLAPIRLRSGSPFDWL